MDKAPSTSGELPSCLDVNGDVLWRGQPDGNTQATKSNGGTRPDRVEDRVEGASEGLQRYVAQKCRPLQAAASPITRAKPLIVLV